MPRTALRRLALACSALGLAAAGLTATATPAAAALPTPVAASTARAYLAELPVRTEDRAGYDRDRFNHWTTVDGACNTRETVLQRDGRGVVTDSNCAATSGTWDSPYDGASWTAASDVDIDHLVPLAEAWDSGAGAWSDAQRETFANDLVQPQLIAVTDNVNQSKSDQGPAEWLPPTSSYHCIYARAWVDVKHHYDLAVDSAEKAALTDQLAGC